MARILGKSRISQSVRERIGGPDYSDVFQKQLNLGRTQYMGIGSDALIHEFNYALGRLANDQLNAEIRRRSTPDRVGDRIESGYVMESFGRLVSIIEQASPSWVPALAAVSLMTLKGHRTRYLYSGRIGYIDPNNVYYSKANPNSQFIGLNIEAPMIHEPPKDSDYAGYAGYIVIEERQLMSNSGSVLLQIVTQLPLEVGMDLVAVLRTLGHESKRYSTGKIRVMSVRPIEYQTGPATDLVLEDPVIETTSRNMSLSKYKVMSNNRSNVIHKLSNPQWLGVFLRDSNPKNVGETTDA